MKKIKLLIHIGASKTGSSAIQHFLKLNRSTLAKKGVILPSSHLQDDIYSGQHVWLFQNLLGEPKSASKYLFNHIEKSILEHDGVAEKVILSAENLSNVREWPDLFEELSNRYEIRLLLYVRRQDDFLASAWQQWNVKIESDFWSWIIQELGKLANWRRTIENWLTLVSIDQIDVRVYERAKLLDGDVVKDFCSFLGINSEDLNFDPQNANPSFSPAVVDFLNNSQLLAEDVHDNHFYDLVYELTGSVHIKRPQESILTYEQRIAILSHYEVTNCWVFENFIKKHGKDSALFSTPSKDDYCLPSGSNINDEKISLLMELLYGMNNKINRLISDKMI